MQNIIQKYLLEMSADSKARLTAYFREEVAEFSLLLSKIILPLQNYHSETPEIDTEDPNSFAFGIMTKGASTLMAAFELSLNGYFWEPPSLLRNAIEGFASAWISSIILTGLEFGKLIKNLSPQTASQISKKK